MLMLVAVSACTKAGGPGGDASGAANGFTRPGRLVFAENEDVKSIDPMLATSGPALDLAMYLFSYAIRYDDRARPVPDALREIPTIENGDVSKDGLTLKYRLRNNIYFHDGVKMTCRDLAFTWKAALNPANNNITHDGYSSIASIDCSDPLVAVVHMKKIYAPFLQQLWGVNGNVPILPEHVLAKYNDAKGSFNTAPFQSAPIGSGPFKFVRWDRGQDVVLTAFDKYFLGKPKLTDVTYRVLPDDSTLVNQLKTHEVDLIARVGANVWPQAKDIPGTTAIAVPSYVFDHVDFNLRRPLFADVRLRRALARAIDKKAIVDKILHDNGDPSDVPVSPRLSSFYDKDTAHYPYDLARARRELDALGWKVGADGIRVRNGQRLAFSYATQSESVNGRAIQAFVQQAWHEVGAEVSVKNAPTAQFFSNTTEGILQGGHYDVAGFAWIGAADPDDNAIYSGKNLAPHGQNALFWRNPIATKAMEDGLSTVDPRKRKEASFREQTQFALDVPSIILDFRRETYAYNSDLKHFTASPVISPFWNPHAYAI